MGPLTGRRIIELAGIGPGPFACMMLADMGAEVIRVERPGSNPAGMVDPLLRNRKSIACDLKDPRAVEVVLRLIEVADGLVEGFRPGVTEKLGLGPDECLSLNPKLVYGRMTGWGQNGPLSMTAGHDINYVAITGALDMIGETGGKPVPPLNMIGDLGGGGMLLAFGMVSAMLHAESTGQGQVVDAAMVDGANTLMAMFHWFKAIGLHKNGPGNVLLGGAAPYYNVYETRDGKYIALGSIEKPFLDLIIEKLNLDEKKWAPRYFKGQYDPDDEQAWPAMKAELEVVFKTKTRDEWNRILEGSDACYTPVLTLDEAPEHPHNIERNAFIDVGGNLQAAPSPRFSKTKPSQPQPAVNPGRDSRSILSEIGYREEEIESLLTGGAISG